MTSRAALRLMNELNVAEVWQRWFVGVYLVLITILVATLKIKDDK